MGNAILAPVGRGDLVRQTDDRPFVDRIDPLGAGATGHQSEDPGARTEVQHHVAGRDDLLDSPLEGGHPGRVSEVETMLVEDE